MDDIVKAALAKRGPILPDCYGWLGLDARVTGACATTRRSRQVPCQRRCGRARPAARARSWLPSSAATTSMTRRDAGSSRTGRSASMSSWSGALGLAAAAGWQPDQPYRTDRQLPRQLARTTSGAALRRDRARAGLVHSQDMPWRPTGSSRDAGARRIACHRSCRSASASSRSAGPGCSRLSVAQAKKSRQRRLFSRGQAPCGHLAQITRPLVLRTWHRRRWPCRPPRAISRSLSAPPACGGMFCP